ncbi:histidine kinase [Desulfovibrio mangrovi]|uniref:histidine kinase n=1 Tax=Desulfovibrio mangrovi TaxID=2976983 RepID=UPI002245EA75|nr:histidine kinase [Desulfovibrio mangrovi]UZP67907.1 histidine kinase [Desulfovibrio mangrovi]
MDKAPYPTGTHSLEQRLRHLEEQARFTLDVLEMASTLGDFQTCINKLHEPTALLEETILRIGELVHFSASAFYLVDENSSDFTLSLCSPALFREMLDAEVQHLIDNGVFALAVRENRPVTVYSRDNMYRLVLHVLATTSRTRGMFVGVMSKGERNLSGILMSLLSIVLKHCANAIESFELYRLFRQGDRDQYLFVDSLPVPVVELSAVGEVVYANAAAVQLRLAQGDSFFARVAQTSQGLARSSIVQCGEGESVNGVRLELTGEADNILPVILHAAPWKTGTSELHVRCILVPA